MIIAASACGRSAHWLRNTKENPKVRVCVSRRMLDGIAEVTTDPEKIADYLQRHLERNPATFRALSRCESLSSTPSSADIVRFASRHPMVAIRPIVNAA